ncbi:hypothetical protein RYA99_22555 [Pseudomonas syringae pv. actinidifoliorum]|nr:hypothetical protein [Pseudomonas syringae pv. actinidifoliorum]MDU8524513.1 hypothetical protein [Pseudomonas syringae pv. actinidifoliorum]MDU8528946.1 hypothetical protein [Pseudomonas syringae pv. actinidifoliorum]
MNGDSIFQDTPVSSLFAKLGHQDKVLLAAVYLYRQIRLLGLFDRCYATDIKRLFLDALQAALSGDKDSIEAVESTVKENIPDTEEYSEQEGSYAQNLMCALSYLLFYCLWPNFSTFHDCVNSALQNLDLLNFERDEDYDERTIILEEVAVISTLTVRVLSLKPFLVRDLNALDHLVDEYWL